MTAPCPDALVSVELLATGSGLICFDRHLIQALTSVSIGQSLVLTATV